MAFTYNGFKYRSKKHPLLEYIFDKKINQGEGEVGDNILFTLKDISEAYRACKIDEPASISNTILDLTRKNNGVEARLPQSIISLGYDLKKRTGKSIGGTDNLAGEFVYVGVGGAINSWLVWPEIPHRRFVIKNKVPQSIIDNGLLGKDEGALFSVIDYCDVLSLALHGEANSVIRVQNPKKWQPNEIDGLYYCEKYDIVYPCEAKALSTGDDINLEQMWGGFLTARSKMPNSNIMPTAVSMITNGINIATFNFDKGYLEIDEFIQVVFNPQLSSWN